MNERVRLTPQAHVVYELDDGLLLVFKPAGHVETAHAHAYRQRICILRGRLRVEAASTLVLDPSSEPRLFAAGERHATTALEPTWLIAETVRR